MVLRNKNNISLKQLSRYGFRSPPSKSLAIFKDFVHLFKSNFYSLNMRIPFLILGNLVFILLFSPLVFATTIVYDDFSGTALDSSKWSISYGCCGPPTENFVDTVNQVYHMLQNETYSPGKDVQLTLTRDIQVGETLEYDINYVSGSGNRIHRFWINNNGIQDLIGCSNCGAVGFWNTPASGGTQFGNYHYKINFADVNTLFLTITRPDLTKLNEIVNISSLTPPYKVTLATGTGHNGLMHFDLDNVIIITEELEPSPEPPCNCSELRERIEALEERVNTLEATVSIIQDSLSLLQQAFEDFRNLILGYLSNAHWWERKMMVCGYMRDNNLTEYSGLGLNCTMKETKGKFPFSIWRNCKCVFD